MGAREALAGGHYIKSMREDISLLTVTNFAVLLVLIFALVPKL